jgi:hypothetical protein
VVGRVEACGSGVTGYSPGDRVGIAWLHRTCGRCRFCTSARENLCTAPRFTGWEVDGGYADQALVPADFAYRLPDSLAARDAAPVLCAGIIGYRASVPAGGSGCSGSAARPTLRSSWRDTRAARSRYSAAALAIARWPRSSARSARRREDGAREDARRRGRS